MSRYPHIDRNPCIVAAGKLNSDIRNDPCNEAKALLTRITLEDKVDVIRKEFGFIDPQDYGPEWLKVPDRDTSVPFTEIRHCIRKPVPTQFELIDEEIKSTIYDSYWNKPIGKCRDPTPGLPCGMNPREVTFGRPSKKEDPAGPTINPPKKFEEVEAEDTYWHNLYVYTHKDYYPGEQIKYGYAPPFSSNNFFGGSGRLDVSGAKVKKCLTWFNNDPISNVSRRQAAVRNRTLPPLGKALDKTGVTDLFPENHTYGKIVEADFYGVEDLLNDCRPSILRRDMLTFMAYINKLRMIVYDKINLGELALEEVDDDISKLSTTESQETANIDCVDRVMKRHFIYLDRKKLEPLLLLLGIMSEDGEVKIKPFIELINKNSNFPKLKKEYYIMPPEYQECSKKFQPRVESYESKFRNLLLPPAGAPSIQTTKPYPYYEGCIVDMEHLGQETTARTLVSPSIFTQYGLSHRDFFKPRTKEFLDNLFRKIDVAIPEPELEEIYNEGYELDKTGGVCIETFRNILDNRAYKAYNKFELG